MCGIAGIFAYTDTAPPIDERELVSIRESMARRGPDGAGLWISPDQRVGLAHRRLSIIDLSNAASQPMATSDGRFHITFNGEIYNYRELRTELAAQGHEFRTASDTEVLLQLFRERGARMVGALRGMYTFAIWDEERKSLFLARDPFGIKPLYYSTQAGTLRFASQVKALLAAGTIDTKPEPAGHVGFFVLGSVPEPYSLYEAIRALPAGHTLTVARGGQPRLESFFDVREEFSAAERDPIPERMRESTLREALYDSVKFHMVADVPVGVFLSAGLDSTTLAAIACETQGSRLHSLTLGFAEYEGTANDEVPLANMTAQRLGTIHTVRRVTRQDFEAERERILDAMDQPSIDGVNTYFVSKAASESGMKVALSGLGADELFAGYPSFHQVPRMAALLSFSKRLGNLGRVARALSAPFVKRIASPKYASLLEFGGTLAGAYLLRRGLYMPWELPDFLDEKVVEEGIEKLDLLRSLDNGIWGLRCDRQKISALELSWYMRNQLLRDADWAGMAHSLEIRVPFVDVHLFRTVAARACARDPYTKSDMARSPSTQLPRSVLHRQKTGFGVPTRQWIGAGGKRESEYRTWARRVAGAPERRKNVLALVTDAFGGRGGIAKFNRDLLRAIASDTSTRHVVAFPRIRPDPIESLPARLDFRPPAAGKLRYSLDVLSARLRRFDLVVCGHLNLLPVAWLASAISGAPLILIVHGIESWNPPPSALRRLLVKRVDRVVAVSATTRDRFLKWSGVDAAKVSILPNCVALESFGLKPKSERLVTALRLENKTVIMTMGRLASAERYKGIDEVIEALPVLVERDPGLVYLIVGDGDDRPRLEEKAMRLGVTEHVRFVGFVPESEKAEYFNLARSFVMPGSGEGFGIVYLEAMASGLPVLGSKLDGSRDALRDGALGILIDPTDQREVVRGIEDVLKKPRQIPEGLAYFDYRNFENRCRRILADSYAG